MTTTHTPPSGTGIPSEAAVAVIASDEQALAAARTLAQEFAAGASARDRERRLPHAELLRLRQSGLWAITVPRDYGGAGVSYATLAEVILLLAAADGSLGQIPQNHFFVVEIIRTEGTEQQKRFFFERLLAGDHFGNALVEPEARLPEQRKVSLRPDGEGYRVDVRKIYCTGALYADWVPVAVSDAEHNNFLALYPRYAQGLTVLDDWAGLGQRTTASGTVLLDDAYIQADWLVPHPIAPAFVKPVGPVGQIMHAAIDAGIARAAFEATIAFTRQRNPEPTEAGWEDDQLAIREVGELAVALHGGEALLERAGRLIDRAYASGLADDWTRSAVAVSQARAATTHSALLISNKLYELAGTRATGPQHNLDRYWRDARTHTLHDPVRWRLFDVGNFYLNDKVPLRRPKQRPGQPAPNPAGTDAAGTDAADPPGQHAFGGLPVAPLSNVERTHH